MIKCKYFKQLKSLHFKGHEIYMKIAVCFTLAQLPDLPNAVVF